MPTNGTAAKKTTTTAAPKRSVDTAVAYVRETAERAVDVPVGAALTVAEGVTDTVKPWTEQAARDKELKRLRAQVTRELNKLERRGGQARRRARKGIEGGLKARRTRVEKAVKDVQAVVQERVGVGSAA